jgi:hypothetical protein
MNTVLMERTLPSNQNIQIVQGDITTEEVNAIVNAANEHLQHSGGVARTISCLDSAARTCHSLASCLDLGWSPVCEIRDPRCRSRLGSWRRG